LAAEEDIEQADLFDQQSSSSETSSERCGDNDLITTQGGRSITPSIATTSMARESLTTADDTLDTSRREDVDDEDSGPLRPSYGGRSDALSRNNIKRNS